MNKKQDVKLPLPSATNEDKAKNMKTKQGVQRCAQKSVSKPKKPFSRTFMFDPEWFSLTQFKLYVTYIYGVSLL